MNDSIFASAAKWIWDGGDPFGYNEYVRFRRDFSLGEKDAAKIRVHGAAALKITADALYQVWLNGHPLGHGPAKSAEGKRSVDGYEIGGLLRAGENRFSHDGEARIPESRFLQEGSNCPADHRRCPERGAAVRFA